MNPPVRGPGIPHEANLALREFVNALGKSAMYPPSHRFVSESAASLAQRLTLAMGEHGGLSIGVTPKGLLLDGVAVEPLPALLREFAQRLHRKNIGTIQVMRDVTRDEVLTMLSALTASDADQTVGQTGLRLERLRVEPLVYDVLAFGDPLFDNELDDVFWAQLVEAAFGRQLAGDEAVPSSIQVAAALSERVASSAESARRVFEALAGFASALVSRGDRGSGSARRRFVDVLSGLSRATTSRVVSAAPTQPVRRRFLRETLELVPPVLLMQILESVAEADGEPISPHLRWLLGKLAGSEGLGDRPASGAFAGEVLGLVEEWEGVGIEDDEEDDPRLGLEPGRVLAIGLELDNATEAVCQAARSLADRGHLLRVLEMLDIPQNDPAVVEVLTDAVLQPDLLTQLLGAEPLDFPLISRVTVHARAAAADPLLDALAVAEDRTTRRRLLDTLALIGPAAEPTLLRRLQGAPWYLARNILATLSLFPAIGDVAPVFGAFNSEDVRVRHEALKVLLRQPVSRDRAASEALVSSEDTLIRTALGHLVEQLSARARGVGDDRPLAPERRAAPARYPAGGAVQQSPGRSPSAPARANQPRVLSPHPTAAQVPDDACCAGGAGPAVVQPPTSAGCAEPGGEVFGRRDPVCAREVDMSEAIRFLHTFAQALSTMALYSPGHPATKRSIEGAWQALGALLRLDDRPIFLFLGTAPVYSGRALHELHDWPFARRLADAGVQRLEFDAMVTEESLTEFFDRLVARLNAEPDSAGTGEELIAGVSFGTVTVEEATQSEEEASAESEESHGPYQLELSDELEAMGYVLDEGVRGVVARAEVEAIARILSGLLEQHVAPQVPFTDDPERYWRVHPVNTALLAMSAARTAGVDPAGCHRLGVTALFHDIGMTRLPAGIGNQSSLTPEDREIVESHTREGARLLLAAGGRGLELAATVAYEHHLRPDGSGYPQRRFHPTPHWASRLIGTVATFVTLRAPRPYRPAWSAERMLDSLQEGAGTVFDAESAQLLLALLRTG